LKLTIVPDSEEKGGDGDGQKDGEVRDGRFWKGPNPGWSLRIQCRKNVVSVQSGNWTSATGRPVSCGWFALGGGCGAAVTPNIYISGYLRSMADMIYRGCNGMGACFEDSSLCCVSRLLNWCV
jgi:hypothetical protein